MRTVLLILIIGLVLSSKGLCDTVDTIKVYSKAMHKKIPCIVILPEHSMESDMNYPVVYLLHGYSGNYLRWLTRVPPLKEYADIYHLIIVCPDGGYDSWYIDSPVDSAVCYETFLTKELVPYIDSHFPTIDNRSGRGICGNSMGGYGALFIAFSHPNEYGAVVSISGCVDIRKFSHEFGLEKVLGNINTHPENWEKFGIMSLIDSLHNGELKISLSCGMNDIFIKVNRALHKKLQRFGIDHSYIERPGAHNWNYWRNAIVYQLLFFKRSFIRLR